ncbi:MAG: hypothetical protein ABIJ09_08495 [Pseudomonadota bacterium]
MRGNGFKTVPALGVLCCLLACPDPATTADSGGGTDARTADSAGADRSTADQGTAADVAGADSSEQDAARGDSSVADTRVADSAAVDTATTDARVADSATVDTSTADTHVADTSTPDSNATDVLQADVTSGDTALPDAPAPDGATMADSGGPAGDAAADGGGIDTAPAVDAAIDAGPECSGEDSGPSCGDPQVCCSGHCVDLLADPNHCGACGASCGSTQFCADTPGCTPLGFSTLCDNDTRISVGSGVDDDITLALNGAAIAAHCTGTVTHTTLLDASVVDQTTHAPLVGVGNTIILHGGPYFQLMLQHFEDSDAAPLRYVFDNGQNRHSFVRTDGSGVVIEVPASLTTASHDYFVVELFPDPERGALILASYGFDIVGSRAAGWYLVNHLLAAPDPQASWFVVEWTDLDSDQLPSSMSEFTLIRTSLD